MAKIDETIIKFLNNELDADGRQELMVWLAENSSHKNYFKRIESLYNASGIIGNPEKYSSDYAHSLLRNQIQHDKALKKIRKRYLWYNVASVAAVLLFAVLYFWIIAVENVKEEKQLTFFQEIVTPKGSKAKLVLGDGTRIWLNADSRLVYPGNTDNEKREVSLQGEAYFEVEKNEERPFFVRAGEINVKVTGTSFNIKNYPEEKVIEATLMEGEVIIESAAYTTNREKQTELITLKPNEKITLYKKDLRDEKNQEDERNLQNSEVSPEVLGSAVVTENVDLKKTLSWKNNKVIFEHEPFADIVNQLERRFGVRFIFESERAKQLLFTGTFDEISIEGALEAMSFASPFTYQIKKDTIIITN